MMYTILEQKLLLFVLDREIDLGTIRVDDGFSGGQERSVQDNGCSRVSSSFHNHEFYENIWLPHSDKGVFKNSFGVA